jgi:hypothetical protein
LKKPGKDFKSKVKFTKTLYKTAKDAVTNGTDSLFALVQPDIVQPGLFDPDLELVFSSGWPRTNLSRLPCVGIITVINIDTWDLQATNLDFIPTCQ